MNRRTDEKRRCEWARSGSPEELEYHDEEWGVPCFDDRHLFEMLILEGAQAGLSWSTILRKREGYRQAFDDFDVRKVARYTEARKARLLRNPAIVRNRLKVASAIVNARAFLEVEEEFGSFSEYIWRFVDGAPFQNRWRSLRELPASTPQSEAMSRDLKKRGFKFVGATICYAYMQAVGMVNDHTVGCFRRCQVARLAP